MLRTYKSRKETGGGLDHRDILLTVDERSSAFDAFYIQNIKQVKRELSSVVPPNYTSSKSRKKKKYVKRLVKEVESPRSDSVSSWTFLTPDKSIRVNKGDIFDQLLNSTPQNSDTTRSSNNDLFDMLKNTGISHVKKKSYSRIKSSQIRKINCSYSNSSDSEKDNEDNDITEFFFDTNQHRAQEESSHETSDIRQYKLRVEKNLTLSPKPCDDSITNIAKKLPLLKNGILNKTNSPVENSYKDVRHRLTTNLQSPISKNSPLSSTPFSQKCRSKSIYRFSPIPLNLEDSSKDNAKDNTFIEDNGIKEQVESSPILQKSVRNKSVPKVLTSLQMNDDSKESSFKELGGERCGLSENLTASLSIKENEVMSPIIECTVSKLKKSQNISKKRQNSATSSMQHSSLEKSALVPFIVFSNAEETKYVSVVNNETENKSESLFSTEETTLPSQPFLGFTNNESVDCEPIIDKDNVNKDIEITDAIEDMCPENSRAEITKHNIDRSCTVISDNSSESMYDTCDSDSIEDIDVLPNMPLVKVERMKKSSFEKYFSKIRKSTDEINSLEKSLETVSSSSSSSISSTNINSLNADVIETSTEDVQSPKRENSEWEYECTSTSDSDSAPVEDERCFVTTRRRNEVLRQSVIFENSYRSSGSDNNNTVVVNPEYNETDKLSSPNVSIVSVDTAVKEVLLSSNNINSLLGNDNRSTIYCSPNERNSPKMNEDNVNVSCRKSRLIKDDLNTSVSGNKAIVLMPGKKWERSLSIFKRMTVMQDRFDRTILDEEDLTTKGRNYRQSVIHTMELQDNGSLLHNDSFCSQRSSFAPKPNRSTFRLVKEPASFRISIANSIVSEDLQEFLAEDCDDTFIELSKLSLADDLDLTVIDKVHAAPERVTTACDYVLRRCNQTDLLPFDECYPDTLLKNCHKIGEGVYGEVFLLRGRDGRTRVMKVVPVAGSTVVNGERQKGYHEIIAEIVIAMELSALRAPITDIERHLDAGEDQRTLELTRDSPNATDVFNQVLEVHCVRGLYPARLLELWDLWDETRGSDNDCPAVLPENQQYIVLELAHAGQDLESYVFNSAEQAYGTFVQVAFGLAVGEAGFQLEHRDLHWGNVLVAPTQKKYATFVLEGRVYRVPRRGVAATIIDYSLSRLSLKLGDGDDSAALYNDLGGDDSLFSAYGDYQFEVYRLMKDRLGNDWKKFEPYTNVLWLHYTVDKMVTALRYKRTNTKLHKHYISKLKNIRERLLDYSSATDFVHSLEEY